MGAIVLLRKRMIVARALGLARRRITS